MHIDLEAIVSADEEARSRVAMAEEARDRDLSAARAARDSDIAGRRRETQDAFDRELRAIRDEGQARVAELQKQQAAYLLTLAEAGEQRFEEAVAVYLRIVCEAGS